MVQKRIHDCQKKKELIQYPNQHIHFVNINLWKINFFNFFCIFNFVVMTFIRSIANVFDYSETCCYKWCKKGFMIVKKKKNSFRFLINTFTLEISICG